MDDKQLKRGAERSATQSLLQRFFTLKFLLFLFVGASNTILTVAGYLLTVGLIGHQPSYVLWYAIGILYSLALNARYTFQARVTLGVAIAYGAVYISTYLVGAGALELFVSGLGIGKRLAIFFVIACTTPLNYLLASLVLKEKKFSSERTVAPLPGPRRWRLRGEGSENPTNKIRERSHQGRNQAMQPQDSHNE